MWASLPFASSPEHCLPRIQFLFIGSRLCSTLLSDLTSRLGPCASLSLHLHLVVKRTCTSKLSIMLGTQIEKALRHRRRAFVSNTSERSFVGLWRLRGSRRIGLWFAAIKPAHDIGADGPRRNLRGLRLLAFAVRLFVGRADERAFDEYVSALLASR